MIEPSLPDLQEHISKFQAELKKMRQQFASRKAKLSSLISRRSELQAQLQLVETEMADLISALATEEPSPAAPSVEAPSAVTTPKALPKSPKPAALPAGQAKTTKSSTKAAPKVMPATKATPTLRQLILDILKVARKPITSGDLTKRVLATGYKTNSKRLVKVVGAQLSKMDNIEHVKGQGYQLKR